MNLKISVIIPIYNVEQYLRECLDSVIKQSYENLEVILVDDGSPDKSPEICDEYAGRDSRIKVIHKLNGGLSDARNAGIEVATGEYIMFVDSDDVWLTNTAVEDIVSILSDNPDMVFWQRTYYNGTSRTLDRQTFDVSSINGLPVKDVWIKLISNKMFPASAWCKVIKSSIILNNNIRFTKGIISEDIDWTFSLMPFIHKIVGYPIPFYGYRHHENSITTKIREKNLYDYLWIIERWANYYKADTKLDNELRFHYLSQLAYYYCIHTGYMKLVSSSVRNDLNDRFYNLRWLIKYDGIKKLRPVLLAYRVFGYRIMRWVFSLYLKYKGLATVVK